MEVRPNRPVLRGNREGSTHLGERRCGKQENLVASPHSRAPQRAPVVLYVRGAHAAAGL